MKILSTVAIAIVLFLHCGCTRSNSVSKSELEFLIVAEVGKFDKDSLAAVETPSDAEGAKLYDLVKDANGVTIGRWVGLAREYAPEKEADQRAFKFVPYRENFIRDGATRKLIDLGTFAPGTDFEQVSNDFTAWLNAQEIRSVQILCEHPPNDELVTGQHFRSVRASIDQAGRPCAAFAMTSKGADNIHKLTSLNQGRLLGIVIRNELHTAPNIESTISKNGLISGNFTQEEVDDLVFNLIR